MHAALWGLPLAVMGGLIVGASNQTIKSRSPAKPRIVTGEMRLTENMRLTAPRLVLEDLTIVTNGHGLELEADTVEIRRAATIRSFVASPSRPSGERGRDAGAIVVRARRVWGQPLTLDNSGEDGAAGAPGTQGSKGSSGEPGESRIWDPIRGCTGGRDGQSGREGGPGGDGGPGGAGGDGGALVIEVSIGASLITERWSAKGGRGGPGGVGGSGGVGGNGGNGGSGNTYCGGTHVGASGPAGPTGRSGPAGPDGKPGRIVRAKATKTPATHVPLPMAPGAND